MTPVQAAPVARASVLVRPALPAARLSATVAQHIVLPVHPPPQAAASPAQPPPPVLPLAGTLANGSLQGWPAAAPRWSLPGFTLADGVDTVFAFAAVQSGTDDQGNPFNKLAVTFRVRKLPATPGCHEVTLTLATPTLTLCARNAATGAAANTVINGAAAAQADGSVILTFDNILGVNAVILFQNLRAEGNATLTIGATYQAWPAGTGAAAQKAAYHPAMFFRPEVSAFATAHALPGEVRMVPGSAGLSPHVAPVAMVNYRAASAALPPPHAPVPSSAAFSAAIPLGLKYAQDPYREKYTIAAGPTDPPRPIVSVDDLHAYTRRQSEFREMHELGDPAARYPSIARLFLGELSRVVIAIPARFVIGRDASGCAAQCQLLLDSGSTSADAAARFEFDFQLQAGISPIDLALLAQDIGAAAVLRDCTVTTPAFLHNPGKSALQTIFVTDSAFGPGAAPHSFALTVSILDGGAAGSAIGNGNLLIRSLAAPNSPWLSGVLDLRIDDMLADPVLVPVVLNFGQTGGHDDFAADLTSAPGKLRLVSRSPYDLSVARIALCQGGTVTVLPCGQTVKAGGMLDMALPPRPAGDVVLVDATPVYAGAADMDAICRYLAIHVQDVQNIRCTFGINAGGVAFQGHGIASIDVQIQFTGMADVAPATMTLSPLTRQASASVPVPIAAVLGALPGIVTLTARFSAAGVPVRQMTVQNDFLQRPILTIADADLFAADDAP